MPHKVPRVYCHYRAREIIRAEELERMYEIFCGYYGNADRAIFERDFGKKHGAFLVRRKDDERIVGFSTLALLDLDMNGRRAIGVFSGDTIIEREYWGSRALQLSFFLFLVRTVLRHPFTPVFWLLISKGYKTYLLLANNFFRFYPHPEGRFRNYAPMVQSYAEQLFPGCYDAERQVLDFGESYHYLLNGVGTITDAMRRRYPNIAFFEECNPEWQRGTELPCIGRAGIYDVVLYVFRFLSKMFRPGKDTAAALPAAPEAEVARSAR